ncbi:fimbrial protein [Photobacterium leiognathi]|uniref:fimbrial protein n=1 Tax=Photobacterium leiognathi TaxID=553611 RepID=UPI00076A92DA|nr:fimbrial protein [Photobacterium leiognathi]
MLSIYKKNHSKAILFLLLFSNTALSENMPIITVYGKVLISPCESVPINENIDIGTLKTGDFINKNSSSPWKKLKLNLDHCPMNNFTVRATFNAEKGINADDFKNNGTAKNLDIQIKNADNGSLVTPGSYIDKKINDNSVEYSLLVRAFTPNGNVTKGTIQSIITVTYQYL